MSEHSVRVPTAAEELEIADKALNQIAWILAAENWSVGMLEDIAAITKKQRDLRKQKPLPPHNDYISH